jgi:hypothetical protein
LPTNRIQRRAWVLKYTESRGVVIWNIPIWPKNIKTGMWNTSYLKTSSPKLYESDITMPILHTKNWDPRKWRKLCILLPWARLGLSLQINLTLTLSKMNLALNQAAARKFEFCLNYILRVLYLISKWNLRIC